MKLFPRDVNPNPYPLHSISTYTYKMIIISKVRSDCLLYFKRIKVSIFPSHFLLLLGL